MKVSWAYLGNDSSATNAMIKILLAGAILATLAVVSLSCTRGSDAIRIATEGVYPPYNFINEDGELDGFERELGDELCRRANLKCVWVIDEWDGMISDLAAGDYDAIITGMSITDERDRIIDFTKPYVLPTPSVFVGLSGTDDRAVSGKVAAQVATIHADYLSQSGATPMEYELAPQAIEAVLNGDVDAAMFDRGFAIDSIAESEGKLELIGPEIILGSGTAAGVQEGDSQLKDKLDIAIDSMKEDGSLNVLIKKWLGPEAATF